MARQRTAERVRNNAEGFQREHAKVFEESLHGMCAICAVALARQFLRHGYFAKAAYGKFYGGRFPLGEQHCWVVVQTTTFEGIVREIWDITATQYGDFPKVFVSDADDPHYGQVGWLPDEEDVEFWATWPSHQRPTDETTAELLRGVNGHPVEETTAH